MPPSFKIFIIYALEDVEYLAELRSQLMPLEIAGCISVWSDLEIDPGMNRQEAMEQNLNVADIMLILVSANYYASAGIYEKELNLALERQSKGDIQILPVIVKPCAYEDDPVLSQMQVLPGNGKAVTDVRYWSQREEAWLDVVTGIKRALNLTENPEKTPEEIKDHAGYEHWWLSPKVIIIAFGCAWMFVTGIIASLFDENEGFRFLNPYATAIFFAGIPVVGFAASAVRIRHDKFFANLGAFLLFGIKVSGVAILAFIIRFTTDLGFAAVHDNAGQIIRILFYYLLSGSILGVAYGILVSKKN